MKKYILFILLMICPMFVHAESFEYHVCKSGCDYTELEEVFGILNSYTGGYDKDVTIYIDDAETYNLTNNNFIHNNYGYDQSIYRYRVNKLVIEGTNGKPKITTSSVHQDGNYSERSIYFAINDDILIKNVKFETPKSILFQTRGKLTMTGVEIKAEGFGSYFTASDNIINDFKLDGYLDLSGATVKNATINGSIIADNHFIGENIKLTGTFESIGTVALKNTVIDADSEDYGLYFRYNDCLGDCGYGRYKGSSSLNNVTIKNANKSAVYYNRSAGNEKRQLTINNSDLSNNPTSIIMYNLYSWSYNDFFDGYSVVGKNSKLSGAETYMGIHEHWNGNEDEIDQTKLAKMKALNMYFDATNTWVKPIYRINDPSKKNNKKANVVETDKGRIVIQRKNSGVLVINVDKNKPLKDYFEELGTVLGEIKIDNPNIVKVENGKIIPLKKGVTNIRFMVDNNEYVLAVTVERDPENPDTLDKIIISGVLLVISFGLVMILAKMKINGKTLV